MSTVGIELSEQVGMREFWITELSRQLKLYIACTYAIREKFAVNIHVTITSRVNIDRNDQSLSVSSLLLSFWLMRAGQSHWYCFLALGIEVPVCRSGTSRVVLWLFSCCSYNHHVLIMNLFR